MAKDEWNIVAETTGVQTTGVQTTTEAVTMG